MTRKKTAVLLPLRMELVPKPLWRENLRTKLGPKKWRIFVAMLSEESPDCDICGSLQGPRQAHEEWDYEEGESSGVAKLNCIRHVCQDCHSIIHIGRTQKLLRSGAITQTAWKRLVAHFLIVNDCDLAAFRRQALEAKLAYDRRSKLTWTLDLSDLSPVLEVVSVFAAPPDVVRVAKAKQPTAKEPK